MPAQAQPQKAFFGAYRPAEAEMRQTLSDAAEEIERLLPKLLEKHTTGNQLKAAQLALILREVRAQQHAMWTDLHESIRDGMQRSALAAVEGESIIDQYLRRAGLDMPELRQSFRAQAQRGFKNVLAKGFNGIPLSRQVYKTEALANDWVNRLVRKALILQTDARTLARQARDFIDPNVKGGVSFAAFRLARTELNNAFHTVAIERFDEPWATGVEWHLSGSHPPGPPGKPEVCERYARVDHGLGIGVFRKDDVPRKPHPQCLCYITQQVVSEDEFLDKLLDGAYDEHLGYRQRKDPPAKDPAILFLEATAHDPANSTNRLINTLISQYGVKYDDAKAMVQHYRPPKKRAPRKPKAPVNVPLDPEKRQDLPARDDIPRPPASRGGPVQTPPKGQHTGPIQTNKAPTSPDQPSPSQVDDDLKKHLEDINQFRITKHRERIRKGLERQAGFVPKAMSKLRRVKDLDREAPSYGVPGVVGEYDDRNGTLFIDISAFTDANQRSFKKEVATGYLSKCGEQFDCLDSLMAHECGHHVHDRWYLKAPTAVQREIWRGVAGALGLPAPQFFDEQSLLRWSTKHKMAIENLVSRYGSSNHLELLAEIWHEYTVGTPPRPAIRQAGEILQRYAEDYS